MNNTYHKAADAFDSGLYCAGSVLKVIAEEEGINSELLPGIATGFCSGMSRTCDMCGAVTGGILSLSLIFERNLPGDSVDKNYKAVQKLISCFESEFKTSNCKELLGINLDTEEDQQVYQKNELHLKCREYTGKAAEIVRTIIDINKKP